MFTRFASLLALLAFATLAAGADIPPPAAAASPEKKFEFETFILVLLLRPANAPELAPPEAERLQQAHMANMRLLASEGKLFKAGPVEDYSGRNVRGIFIMKTDSVEKARAWVATDPAVKAGRLAPEFMQWAVEKGSLK